LQKNLAYRFQKLNAMANLLNQETPLAGKLLPVDSLTQFCQACAAALAEKAFDRQSTFDQFWPTEFYRL
jgi:hypothetical protein